MRSNVFTKLLGLILLLLLFQTLVTALLFRGLLHHADPEITSTLVRDAFLACVIGLIVALPVATFFAGRISARLERVVAFARNIANGDLSTRLPTPTGHDEFAEMET